VTTIPLPRHPDDRPVLLWRDPATAQLGTDPATAVTLAGLTPPLAALVRDLAAGAPPRRAVSEVLARGGAPGEVAAVVAALAGAGLLAPPRPAPGAAYVRVHGAGRLGAAVAVALAAAGVGRVAVRAPGTVAAGDLGTGLRAPDVGRSAVAAVAEAVARAAPAVVVSEPTRRRPDLAVLVGAEAADPVLSARLHARHQPHLAVAAHGGTGTVGPLVLPGRGACLRCADRGRAAADPAWPRLAAQLAGRPATVGIPTAGAVAALAAEHVLAHLAGVDTLVDRALELDLAAGTLTGLTCVTQPGCACAPHPPGVRPGRAVPGCARDNRPRVVR
jgi:bacteriocin biosynthesis cyclodehydratase domain-containing protein